MSTSRFCHAVCLAAANLSFGTGLSMLLHMEHVLPGPLMVSGSVLFLAVIVPERGRS